AANALQRPIMNAASGKLLAGMLPEKPPIGLVEADQHAQSDIAWIALQVSVAVVCSQPDLARRDNRVAIGLAAERADPLNVLGARRLPVTRLAIEITRRPISNDSLGYRRVVTEGCATPLIPVARLDGWIVGGRIVHCRVTGLGLVLFRLFIG